MLRSAAVLCLAAVCAAQIAVNTRCIPEISYTAPFWNDGPLVDYQYTEFNVISFGDFYTEGGDVQGRLLVRGNYEVNPIGGFTVGDSLQTVPPNQNAVPHPYSLVIGGIPAADRKDICWRDGNVFPDGINEPTQGPAEGYFFPTKQWWTTCFPQYLSTRQFGMCPQGDPECLASNLDEAETYFKDEVIRVQGLPDTTTYITALEGKEIIILAPANPADDVKITIPNSVWNPSTFQTLDEGIDTQTQKIMIVIENDDGQPTVFHDAEFPGVMESTAFYFGCDSENPDVLVNGGMRGAIIAPCRNYEQEQGVTDAGIVVVANISRLHQANLPPCPPGCRIPCGVSGECCETVDQCCQDEAGSDVCCRDDLNGTCSNDITGSTSTVLCCPDDQVNCAGQCCNGTECCERGRSGQVCCTRVPGVPEFCDQSSGQCQLCPAPTIECAPGECCENGECCLDPIQSFQQHCCLPDTTDPQNPVDRTCQDDPALPDLFLCCPPTSPPWGFVCCDASTGQNCYQESTGMPTCCTDSSSTCTPQGSGGVGPGDGTGSICCPVGTVQSCGVECCVNDGPCEVDGSGNSVCPACPTGETNCGTPLQPRCCASPGECCPDGNTNELICCTQGCCNVPNTDPQRDVCCSEEATECLVDPADGQEYCCDTPFVCSGECCTQPCLSNNECPTTCLSAPSCAVEECCNSEVDDECCTPLECSDNNGCCPCLVPAPEDLSGEHVCDAHSTICDVDTANPDAEICGVGQYCDWSLGNSGNCVDSVACDACPEACCHDGSGSNPLCCAAGERCTASGCQEVCCPSCVAPNTCCNPGGTSQGVCCNPIETCGLVNGSPECF